MFNKAERSGGMDYNMANYRVDRIAEDIKQEVYDIMRTLKDPRITGLLSIVKVEVAPDVTLARIYVSSLDGFDRAKEAVVGLNSAAGFVRRELNGRLKLRRSPEIKFIADNGIEQSAKISKMLDELKKDEGK